MRIRVERTGGFGGVRRSAEVDTDTLPDDEASEVRRLVDEVNFSAPRPAPARGGDRFQFDVTVEDAGQQRTVTVYEGSVQDPLQRLIDKVLSRRGGT